MPPLDDPATPDDLSEAGEKSNLAPYRLEIFMAMSGIGLSIDADAPLVTGEYANGTNHMVMDIGQILESIGDEMPPEMLGIDTTMEMVTQGSDMYIRAPFFAALADEAGGATGPLGVFTTLGAGWGYVDGSALPGMSAGQVTGTLGISAGDPTALFALLSDVEGVEAIGTEEIRGVSSVGIRAEVSFADLLAAQGTDISQLPITGIDVASWRMPIEVWIDKDSFVRRIVVDIGADAFADAAESTGQEIDPDVLGGFEVSMTMEMFDYNDAAIVIEIPTDFVDITDDFIELLDQQAG